MKKVILFASAAFVMLLMACGSAGIIGNIARPQQAGSITVQTIPSGAEVYVNGAFVSKTTPVTLPVSISISGAQAKRIKSIPYNIQILKEGYEVVNDVFEFKWNGNQFSGPENLIYELKKRSVSTNDRAEAYVKDPTIPAGAAQERVTRDTSGNTALERTIIRWYFDSAPQGARIFWRIISSVPDEVKNTNELWLGSTPFEETRAFNIQGLTYENSRDVQIEIKVKRKGYVDQSKRFNVRQAIDQQEISSFFDLVED